MWESVFWNGTQMPQLRVSGPGSSSEFCANSAPAAITGFGAAPSSHKRATIIPATSEKEKKERNSSIYFCITVWNCYLVVEK